MKTKIVYEEEAITTTTHTGFFRQKSKPFKYPFEYCNKIEIAIDGELEREREGERARA